MDRTTAERYHKARAAAGAKAAAMPGWLLRGCAAHAIGVALAPAGRACAGAHEAAWGFADGYADEVLRRRARPAQAA